LRIACDATLPARRSTRPCRRLFFASHEACACGLVLRPEVQLLPPDRDRRFGPGTRCRLRPAERAAFRTAAAAIPIKERDLPARREEWARRCSSAAEPSGLHGFLQLWQALGKFQPAPDPFPLLRARGTRRYRPVHAENCRRIV